MQKNVKDRKFKVYCEQKYGPKTTARRNIAMRERRSLLYKKEIAKSYVAYPAKLMVAKNKKDNKYYLHADFSHTDVQIINAEARLSQFMKTRNEQLTSVPPSGVVVNVV